ncbi:hypothetical protein VTL71DRAFT_9546 [Oculimacula yallundae]|uniref:Uncharacterized protein n=1 Tax=Oculimacula yallundae TaxID=86028 RepID=A0ABR4BS84_9HELO
MSPSSDLPDVMQTLDSLRSLFNWYRAASNKSTSHHLVIDTSMPTPTSTWISTPKSNSIITLEPEKGYNLHPSRLVNGFLGPQVPAKEWAFYFADGCAWMSPMADLNYLTCRPPDPASSWEYSAVCRDPHWRLLEILFQGFAIRDEIEDMPYGAIIYYTRLTEHKGNEQFILLGEISCALLILADQARRVPMQPVLEARIITTTDSSIRIVQISFDCARKHLEFQLLSEYELPTDADPYLLDNTWHALLSKAIQLPSWASDRNKSEGKRLVSGSSNASTDSGYKSHNDEERHAEDHNYTG